MTRVRSSLCNAICGHAGLLILSAVLLCGTVPTRTQAGPLITWDFENSTTAGSISTSVGLALDPNISGIASQTGGGPVEFFGGFDPKLITRNFGTFYPFLQLTVQNEVIVRRVSFDHVHNHNPGSQTSPSYYAQLQLLQGSAWVDVGDAVLLDNQNSNTKALVGVNLLFDHGTHVLRWDPRGLAYGSSDTGTEYFALDNVTLSSSAVPEPGTWSLMGLGCGGALLLARRQRIGVNGRVG